MDNNQFEVGEFCYYDSPNDGDLLCKISSGLEERIFTRKEGGQFTAKVYRIELMSYPNKLAFVVPAKLSKQPNRNTIVSWDDCVWKPNFEE